MRKNIFVIFAFAALLLAGCTMPPGDAAQGGQPQMGAQNGSAQGQPAQNGTGATNPPSQTALPADYTASLGDNVSVIYALYIDGKVYDTNNATLANESGTYSKYKRYEPLGMTLAFNKGIIDGFVINMVGLKANETVSFDVDPERGYGLYDPAKKIVVPRFYNKSVYESVPRIYFTERGLNVSNGTGFDSPYGTVFVTDFNDDNVTLYYMSLSEIGYTFSYNGLNQRVNSTSDFTATIELLLEQNRSYILPDPETGSPTSYFVLDKTDENITLDYNHPLANKTLHFVVTMLDIRKGAG